MNTVRMLVYELMSNSAEVMIRYRLNQWMERESERSDELSVNNRSARLSTNYDGNICDY